jgi:hypothetical protein
MKELFEFWYLLVTFAILTAVSIWGFVWFLSILPWPK